MKILFTFLLTIASCFTLSAQNRGLNFDGVDDYVHIENPIRPATFITVEAWFNPSASASNGPTMLSQGQYQWSIYNNGGTWASGSQLYVELYNTATFASVNYTLTSSLANSWHHVAFTYDGTVLKVYLDGIEIGQAPLTGALPTTNIPLVFGDYLSGGTQYPYQGTLDEVRIWDIARTQAQIQSAMFTEIPANTAGLIAYYKFNQGTIGGNNAGITTLSDAVATPHNGTINNFALTGPTSNWVEGYPLLNVLPLKLTSFTAEKEGGSVTLQWKASVMFNISTFDIERSSDGSNFSKIGFVSSGRNGTGEGSYTFKDNQPGAGLKYYRLRTVDDFGKITYSPVLLIRLDGKIIMAVFPNPVTNTLQLQTTQKGDFTVFIQDAWQRVVKRLQVSSSSGLLSTSIDVSNLPKGLYFIRIADKQIEFSKQ